MSEPLFNLERIQELRAQPDVSEAELTHLRDRSLLFSATALAIASAFQYGVDLPVGAVTAHGDWINGRYFASDKRADHPDMHAEYMAVAAAKLDIMFPQPDTLVVTLEPCDGCQNFLARVPGLKRVGFVTTRDEVAERGLVKPHDETIFERADRLKLPYEVVQIEDPLLHKIGGLIFDSVERDPVTETVRVDAEKLRQALDTLAV